MGAKGKKDNKTMWIVVLVAVIVVVLPMVVATALYYMTLGLTNDNTPGYTPNVQILSKVQVTGGYKVALTSPTSIAKWGDVQMQLTTTSGISSWNLKTITWTGTTPADANMSASLGVYLLIRDLAGDGQIGSGDYMTFTGVPAGTVTLTMVYTPTGSAMMSGATIACASLTG